MGLCAVNRIAHVNRAIISIENPGITILCCQCDRVALGIINQGITFTRVSNFITFQGFNIVIVVHGRGLRKVIGFFQNSVIGHKAKEVRCAVTRQVATQTSARVTITVINSRTVLESPSLAVVGSLESYNLTRICSERQTVVSNSDGTPSQLHFTILAKTSKTLTLFKGKIVTVLGTLYPIIAYVIGGIVQQVLEPNVISIDNSRYITLRSARRVIISVKPNASAGRPLEVLNFTFGLFRNNSSACGSFKCVRRKIGMSLLGIALLDRGIILIQGSNSMPGSRNCLVLSDSLAIHTSVSTGRNSQA